MAEARPPRASFPKWVSPEAIGVAMAYCAGAPRWRAPDGRVECPSLVFVSGGAGARAGGFVQVGFEDAAGHERSLALRLGASGPATMHPRSTAFGIALARRLALLFGGDFDAGGEPGAAEERLGGPAPIAPIGPNCFDGSEEGSKRLWRALWEIAPLSLAELETANGRARLPTRDEDKAGSWRAIAAAGEAFEIERAMGEPPARGRGKAL